MKTKSCVFMCLLMMALFLTPSALMAQSKYVVTGQKVNVRSSASTKGAVVGSLSSGTVVTVKDIKNGWATISYKGKTCYVNTSFLKQQSSGTARQAESRPVQSAPSRNYSARTTSRPSRSYSDPDRGFAMSSDIALGYSKKVFSTQLGFDAGYRFNRMLYIGAGPMLEGDFSDGGSAFGAGVYGKVRFTAPLESSVKPMLGARVGYMYNFTASAGDLYYGGELGLNFSQKYNVGIMVTITSTTTRTTTKHTNTFSYTPGGKQRTVNYTTTDSNTEYFFTPALFFSIDF